MSDTGWLVEIPGTEHARQCKPPPTAGSITPAGGGKTRLGECESRWAALEARGWTAGRLSKHPDLMSEGAAGPHAHQTGAVDRAISGLAGAAARLIPVDKNNHAIPLTELCWWAMRADDALEKVIGRQPYRAARDADSDGQLASGLRYVRNALGHAQLTATRTNGGLTFPITFPVTFPPITIHWAPAPGLDTGFRNQSADVRARYERHLEDQLVSETTYAARRWLERAHTWTRTGHLPD